MFLLDIYPVYYGYELIFFHSCIPQYRCYHHFTYEETEAAERTITCLCLRTSPHTDEARDLSLAAMPFPCADLQLGPSQLTSATSLVSRNFRREHELLSPLSSRPGSTYVAYVIKLVTRMGVRSQWPHLTVWVAGGMPLCKICTQKIAACPTQLFFCKDCVYLEADKETRASLPQVNSEMTDSDSRQVIMFKLETDIKGTDVLWQKECRFCSLICHRLLMSAALLSDIFSLLHGI